MAAKPPSPLPREEKGEKEGEGKRGGEREGKEEEKRGEEREREKKTGEVMLVYGSHSKASKKCKSESLRSVN